MVHLLICLCLISILSLNHANQLKINERSQHDESLHTRPIFTYNNHVNVTRFNWTRDELIFFENSPPLKKFIYEYYHHSLAWSKPLVFAVVSNEKYTQFIEDLIESLQTVKNILPQDLMVACLTHTCSEKLTSMSIRNIYYEEPVRCRNLPFDRRELHKRERCLLSSVKFQFVLDLLRLNYNVFFLDLDVYIHKFPLPLSRTDNSDLYVQFDEPKELNFGCFVIQSNTKTIRSFEISLALFLAYVENDQRLFSKMILTYHTYTLFPTKQYYALHYGPE